MTFEMYCKYSVAVMMDRSRCGSTGIGLLYRRLPQLAAADALKQEAKIAEAETRQEGAQDKAPLHQIILSRLADQVKDWKEFIHHPIFMSSVAISFLYLTVLSFDGKLASQPARN